VSAERLDTQAILQEVFRPRSLSTSESVMEYARQRQGVVVVVSILVAFLVLAGIHQFVTRRNATAVTNSPAIPLSEITDITKQVDEAVPKPMPDLEFPYDGRPQMMRTYILEPGAVVPATPAPVAPPAPQATTTTPPR